MAAQPRKRTLYQCMGCCADFASERNCTVHQAIRPCRGSVLAAVLGLSRCAGCVLTCCICTRRLFLTAIYMTTHAKKCENVR